MLLWTISVAIVLNVLLLVGLLILVPRLVQRHGSQATDDALRLREMLIDVLSEQEAVTLRQNQIGTSLAAINGDLAKIATATPTFSPKALADAAGLPQLERRIEALQGQLGGYFAIERSARETAQVIEHENWGHLLGLLAGMQDRIAALNTAVTTEKAARLAPSADGLLDELEHEMQDLRDLADDVTGLQHNLRRSLLERESHLADLRAQVRGRALDNRAA